MQPIFSLLRPNICRNILQRTNFSVLNLNNYSNVLIKVSRRQICVSSPRLKKEPVNVVFLKPDGQKTTAPGKEGDSLLDIVVDQEVDIDGFGACEGTLACSTCHLILNQKDYDSLPQPSDEEMDMLDLAFGITDTSRLGCQIIMKKEMDGLEVKVPETINDARQA